MHTGTFLTDARQQVRKCKYCGRLSDRLYCRLPPPNLSVSAHWLYPKMYHCEELGKCLPLFNHFCNALNVPVYLETVKPYLCGLFLLCVDALLAVGSCVWAWSDKQLRSTAIEGSLLFLTILNFCHAGICLASIGGQVALCNMVMSELGRDSRFRGTYMAAQEESPGGVIVRVRCTLGSIFYTRTLFISHQLICSQGSPTIPGISENTTISVRWWEDLCRGCSSGASHSRSDDMAATSYPTSPWRQQDSCPTSGSRTGCLG